MRNEGKWISQTINSVANQTIPPKEYIIVDDVSTDNTCEQVEDLQKNYKFLRLIKLPPREPLATPVAVVRAFNIGYAARETKEPDFIVKLDGDLELPGNFFEECFKAFNLDPKLGITGATLKTLFGDRWITEHVPLHHVRGATKVYRWACWMDIGGFVPRHGWDGIDILQAQMKGWESRHLTQVFVKHFRPSGKREGGIKTRIEKGRLDYYLGSLPIYVLISGVRKLVDWPYIIGGIAIVLGYLRAWVRNEQRIDNPELISFNRRKQLNRITFGLFGRDK